MKKYIKCPQCGRDSEYSLENKFRPFCSERCKLIDLGQWADESFRIPINGHADFTLEVDEEYQDFKKMNEND